MPPPAPPTSTARPRQRGEGETSSSDSGSTDSSGGENVNRRPTTSSAKRREHAIHRRRDRPRRQDVEHHEHPVGDDSDNGGADLSLAGAFTINVVNTSHRDARSRHNRRHRRRPLAEANANTDVLARADGDTKTAQTWVSAPASRSTSSTSPTRRTAAARRSAQTGSTSRRASRPRERPGVGLQPERRGAELAARPSGTTLPTTPNSGDYFELTATSGVHSPACTSTTGPRGSPSRSATSPTSRRQSDHPHLRPGSGSPDLCRLDLGSRAAAPMS